MLNTERQQVHLSRKTPAPSRRQFLREAGLIIGGLAFSPAVLGAGCSSSPTTSPADNPGGFISTSPATSPPNSSQATLANATSPASTLPALPDVYIPPVAQPPLSLIPGCTSRVAFDRLYCIEHTWVKELGRGRAVVGISDKLQLLMDLVQLLQLPKAGKTYIRGEDFGYAEGYKMGVDLIVPVTLRVIQVNETLMGARDRLNTDPYNSGWIAYGEIVKPEEIKGLMSAADYLALQAKLMTSIA